jgi:DNA-binding HxlR family transcriptional regulator
MGDLEQQVSVISHLCKSWNLIIMGDLEQVSVISHLCKSWNLIIMGGLEQQVLVANTIFFSITKVLKHVKKQY